MERWQDHTSENYPWSISGDGGYQQYERYKRRKSTLIVLVSEVNGRYLDGYEDPSVKNSRQQACSWTSVSRQLIIQQLFGCRLESGASIRLRNTEFQSVEKISNSKTGPLLRKTSSVRVEDAVYQFSANYPARVRSSQLCFQCNKKPPGTGAVNFRRSQ